MKRKRKWQMPKTNLRERLREIRREESFWTETEPGCRRVRWDSIYLQLLRPANEYLFQKTVAATLVVIFFGLFSLLNFPLTNRMIDAVHYLTVHQTSPGEILEQARPVFQAVRDLNWRLPGEKQDSAIPAPPIKEEVMAAPVSGVLVSPYGTRLDASGERVEMHYGIDVAADAGTPVFAALTGTVSLIQDHPIYGLTIYLEHGEELVTIYGRCAEPLVKVGDRVNRGQQLAVVAAGQAGQQHLHFEVWKEGKPVDPQEMLGQLQ